MKEIKLFEKGKYKVYLNHINDEAFHLDIAVIIDLGIQGKDTSQCVEIWLPCLFQDDHFEPKIMKINKIISKNDFFHLHQDFSKNNIFLWQHHEFNLPSEENFPYCWRNAVQDLKTRIPQDSFFKISFNHFNFSIDTQKLHDLLFEYSDNKTLNHVVRACILNRAYNNDYTLPKGEDILEIKKNILRNNLNDKLIEELNCHEENLPKIKI